jgi:hypothetical protein
VQLKTIQIILFLDTRIYSLSTNVKMANARMFLRYHGDFWRVIPLTLYITNNYAKTVLPAQKGNTSIALSHNKLSHPVIPLLSCPVFGPCVLRFYSPNAVMLQRYLAVLGA